MDETKFRQRHMNDPLQAKSAAPAIAADRLLVSEFRSFSDLPANFAELLNRDGNYFYSRAWFDVFVSTVLSNDELPRLFAISDSRSGGTAHALLVMKSERNGFARISGLANVYSMDFAVLMNSTVANDEAAVRELFRAMCREFPKMGIIEFVPIRKDGENYRALTRGLDRAGYIVEEFFQFGKWFETINDADFETFLARRPSRLRNTFKRKSRSLEKSGRGRYRLFTSSNDIEEGIVAYEEVYSGSWKKPEPHPEFIPALLRDCAANGRLRLGVYYIDDHPAAAQAWIVHGECATIYKLSYDEEFKSLSLGTILSMELARHVIEVDSVKEIDFGRGDDPYKSDWLSSRREYWGIIAYNPRTIRGCVAGAKFLLIRAVKKIIRRG